MRPPWQPGHPAAARPPLAALARKMMPAISASAQPLPGSSRNESAVRRRADLQSESPVAWMWCRGRGEWGCRGRWARGVVATRCAGGRLERRGKRPCGVDPRGCIRPTPAVCAHSCRIAGVARCRQIKDGLVSGCQPLTRSAHGALSGAFVPFVPGRPTLARGAVSVWSGRDRQACAWGLVRPWRFGVPSFTLWRPARGSGRAGAPGVITVVDQPLWRVLERTEQSTATWKYDARPKRGPEQAERLGES